jgi:uncharacterized protein
MSDRLDELESMVKDIFAKSTQKRYWEHTKRVYAFAEYIGKREGADMEVLRPATILHDVGMTVDAGFPSHIEKSKLLGRFILDALGYEKSTTERILKTLGSHHPLPGAPLDSVEEMALYDADNMEIVGAFGVLRWIGTLPPTALELAGSIDMFLSIVRKCTDARGSLFFTTTARAIGDEAVRSTTEYYEQVKQYLSQFEGECDEPFVGRL